MRHCGIGSTLHNKPYLSSWDWLCSLRIVAFHPQTILRNSPNIAHKSGARANQIIVIITSQQRNTSLWYVFAFPQDLSYVLQDQNYYGYSVSSGTVICSVRESTLTCAFWSEFKATRPLGVHKWKRRNEVYHCIAWSVYFRTNTQGIWHSTLRVVNTSQQPDAKQRRKLSP